MPQRCPRCEILTDVENPLLLTGHCALCEYELTHTPRERAAAWSSDEIVFFIGD
jgi:hypothetical protein